MRYFSWRPYIPVAVRRANAQREVAKLKKQGRTISPVIVEGRIIAKTVWGKLWCTNLERYSDYENRLPRGRAHVRNGSVVDLHISKGKVEALVAGSELYKIKIVIAPVASHRWRAICKDCAGSVDTLVELLQGRFEKGVMNRVSRKGDGLFPNPGEIRLSCSCPDWADMCKHVAAALYGVGARLDEAPQLLFVLRGVNESELLAGASSLNAPVTTAAPGAANILGDGDVAALFGIEMAGPTNAKVSLARKLPLRKRQTKLPAKRAQKKPP